MTTGFRVETEELENGIHEIQVAGELDAATLQDLEGPLTAAIDAGADAVLVNLSDCAFIDSTGLGLLMDAREQITDGADRRFTICCPHDQVRKLLEMTGVDRVVELHATRDEALDSLRR